MSKKIAFVLLLLPVMPLAQVKNTETADNVTRYYYDDHVVSVQIWYGADNSRFGFYDLDKKEKFEDHIYRDTLKLEFRSIAQTSKDVFLLSVGNPALLYSVSKKTQKVKLVYKEVNPKVFYDSMQFWNDKEGIAICLLYTSDAADDQINV